MHVSDCQDLASRTISQAVKTTKEEKAEPEQPKMTRLASKYGMLRKSYLQEHRKGLYLELVLAGKLNEHLHLIDEECNQMMDRLVEQMKEKQGVTEELKMQDQMAWVGRMNNILIATEEVIILSMVYV